MLDPASGRDEPADVLLEDGRVAAIGSELDARGAESLDASGCWVAPAFVDIGMLATTDWPERVHVVLPPHGEEKAEVTLRARSPGAPSRSGV